MPSPSSATPSKRDRTRHALLESGIAVLVTNPGAALGAVARHAGVARSTLHRYFADRAELVEAINSHVEAQYEEAIEGADIESGTGYEAFERIVEELQDRIELFSWWMQTIHAEVDDFDSEPDQQLLATIRRGQADGTIDDQLTAEWIHTMLWTALWTAHKQVTLNGYRPRTVRSATRLTLQKLAAPSHRTHPTN
ncbi:DNA-binding transcriptional regulator, AcrR family [Arthrobacter woluwensis]|uniref:DNA-binding transcriptional regulator, AcrR family n=3 Tax=Arthrobacter woluwensis TaxID=156980 RepID=A0A1H4VVX5_9MICC|nr:DNA-binding transcriptional regulator, AcrR family [Arthrobacter woluwensis]